MQGPNILTYLLRKKQELAPNENPMEFRLVLTLNKNETTFTTYSSDEKKRNLFHISPEYMQILHELVRNHNQMRQKEFGWDCKFGSFHLCLDIRQIGNKRENSFDYLCEFYVWDN